MNWSTMYGDYDRTQQLGFGSPIPSSFHMFISPGAVTVGNTAVETSLLSGSPNQGSVTIPANYLRAGTMLDVTFRGLYQTDAVAPTLTIKIKVGGVVVYTTGALSTGVQATPAAFEANYLIGCTAIGSSGTVTATGVFWGSGTGLGLTPTTAQSGTVNTTQANAFDITVQWGTAAATNTMTLSHIIVGISG